MNTATNKLDSFFALAKAADLSVEPTQAEWNAYASKLEAAYDDAPVRIASTRRAPRAARRRRSRRATAKCASSSDSDGGEPPRRPSGRDQLERGAGAAEETFRASLSKSDRKSLPAADFERDRGKTIEVRVARPAPRKKAPFAWIAEQFQVRISAPPRDRAADSDGRAFDRVAAIEAREGIPCAFWPRSRVAERERDDAPGPWSDHVERLAPDSELPKWDADAWGKELPSTIPCEDAAAVLGDLAGRPVRGQRVNGRGKKNGTRPRSTRRIKQRHELGAVTLESLLETAADMGLVDELRAYLRPANDAGPLRASLAERTKPAPQQPTTDDNAAQKRARR